MRCSLSRREILRWMMIALPAAVIGWKRIDFFDRELVCVHVYDPGSKLPPPLLVSTGRPARRPADEPIFHVGIPELILCRTRTRPLDIYPYFWPISNEEIKQLQGSMQVLHQSQTMVGKEDIDALKDRTMAQQRQGTAKGELLAVIFTLNDTTEHLCAAVVDASRRLRIDELVIFKDPSRSPYLCSYPSRQKGFKRPPPIG